MIKTSASRPGIIGMASAVTLRSSGGHPVQGSWRCFGDPAAFIWVSSGRSSGESAVYLDHGQSYIRLQIFCRFDVLIQTEGVAQEGTDVLRKMAGIPFL